MKSNLLLKSPIAKFHILIILISIPFWILDIFAGNLAKVIPINLPVSALMFVCPLMAVIILNHKEDKNKGKEGLFKGVIDYKKIKKIWYIPIIFTMPAVMLVSFLSLGLMGRILPKPVIPLFDIPIFFILFFISGVCEEIGWMGYVARNMENRYNLLKIGLFIGLVWGIWHSVPYFQAGHNLVWIFWQILTSVFNRILMVWIYYNNEKSLFSTITYHSMINVSVFLFPNYGSHYDPASTAIILGIITVVVILLWPSLRTSKDKLN